MSNYAVEINNIGKMYRIGSLQKTGQTFREAFGGMVTAPIRRARDVMRGQAYAASGLTKEIWALKDVSFNVKHGEVVGIIGNNGAGKSTLLKILSRITDPTEGYADIYGRVGALLEVGTGFHSELTGRENVYLNGAILGMTRNDIDRKFDEIVDFSGVENFIDTPVKHYSSGMGLRLGFAVAAHLEPEILIVDEVLAVGDAEFQKKCIGKMSDVASEGRTVLFVSHNMGAVQNLCSRVVMLESGKTIREGSTDETIAYYMNRFESDAIENDLINIERNSKYQLISKIKLHNTLIQTMGSFGFDVFVELDPDIITDPSVGFTINEGIGGRITGVHSNQYVKYSVDKKQTAKFSVSIENLLLVPGIYSISLYLNDGENLVDTIDTALSFNVTWAGVEGLLYPPRSAWGNIFSPANWSIQNDG